MSSTQDYADNDVEFRALCQRAGVEPTRRQARRFWACKGAAFALLDDGRKAAMRRGMNTERYLDQGAKW